MADESSKAEEAIQTALEGSTAFRETIVATSNKELIVLTAIRACRSKNISVTREEIQQILEESETLGEFFDRFDEQFDLGFQSAFRRYVMEAADELARQSDPDNVSA